MNDLDEQITRVLHRHADDTEIVNHLDAIVSEGRIVRFTTDAERSRRRAPQRFVAAAACVLIVGGGIAISQLRADPANDPVAADQLSDNRETRTAGTEPDGPVFPVLDDVPEISAMIAPTSVTFFAPYVASTTLARIDGDRLFDVVTISAAAAGETDPNEILVPPEAEVSDGTIGGRDVTVYDNAGGRWYRWIDDGVIVLLEASTDSDMIVRQILATEGADSGFAKIDFGALPGGLKIVAAPSPLTGSQPALSTDAEPGEPTLDLYPTDSPLLIQTGVVDGYTIVDVNGFVGYAIDSDVGAIISWTTDSGTWLRLNVTSADTRRITEIARKVQFVDQASWNARYDTHFDGETTTPPTTMP